MIQVSSSLSLSTCCHFHFFCTIQTANKHHTAHPSFLCKMFPAHHVLWYDPKLHSVKDKVVPCIITTIGDRRVVSASACQTGSRRFKSRLLPLLKHMWEGDCLLCWQYTPAEVSLQRWISGNVSVAPQMEMCPTKYFLKKTTILEISRILCWQNKHKKSMCKINRCRVIWTDLSLHWIWIFDHRSASDKSDKVHCISTALLYFLDLMFVFDR